MNFKEKNSQFTVVCHLSKGLFYDRKVRTVPLTNPLHMGHLRKEGAHSLHTTK